MINIRYYLTLVLSATAMMAAGQIKNANEGNEAEPMKFGDGKRDRYYVSGWKNSNQYLGWNINVLKPAQFNVSIRYVKDVGNTGGDMVLKIGGKDHDFSIDPASSKSGHGNTVMLGQIDLPVGKQSVELHVKNIVGEEAVKFLEVVLTRD